MSADLGFTHDQIRAAANIGWCAIYYRDLPTAELWTGRAHELAMEREMVSVDSFTLGELALIDEMRGQWAEAESKARDVLQNLGGYDTTKLVASTLLGRIEARRGEPDAKTRLLDGWERALQTDEIQRTAPASIALAEYVWIGGKLDQAILLRLQESPG